MTVQDLIDAAGQQPWILLAIFTLLPLLSWGLGRGHGPLRGGLSPWKYVYSVLIYVVCLLGVPSVLLFGYQLLFQRANLLQVNLLVYFLPIVSMIVSLTFVSRNVEMDEIPGFDRLWALLVVIALTFGIAYVLDRFFFGVFFHAGLGTLLMIAGVVLVLLQIASHKAFGTKRDPVSDALDESLESVDEALESFESEQG